jgi:hypothetical protein
MYFPWVGMLEQMRLADVFVYLDDAQFSKGGFFNRVQVKTERGTPWLTVPLAENKLGQALNHSRLATHNWRRKHLNTLRQSYASASYAEEMLGIAEMVLNSETESLASLSEVSMQALAGFFDVLPDMVLRSSAMEVVGSGSERVLAICQSLGATRYVTGHGAADYLDHALFEKAGITVEYMDYEKREYQQLHGAFAPYVSSLDLVANCGSAGREVIDSGTIYWKDFLK